MEQYRNCNRNGGRYPAQPNLMMQYANNRNASSCNGNRQGTGGCPSRQDHCETTRKSGITTVIQKREHYAIR